jgi:UDP-glucuronate 4-epimerase
MIFINVYVQGGRPDMAYFRMIRNLLLERDFYLYGDGALKRDFTYIDDAVESVISLSQQAANQQNSLSEVVNIGGGNDYSILELISFVNKLSSKELRIQRQEAFGGDVKQTLADSSKLFALTGKVPQTKLPDGIRKVYEWCSSEPIINQITKWE